MGIIWWKSCYVMHDSTAQIVHVIYTPLDRWAETLWHHLFWFLIISILSLRLTWMHRFERLHARWVMTADILGFVLRAYPTDIWSSTRSINFWSNNMELRFVSIDRSTPPCHFYFEIRALWFMLNAYLKYIYLFIYYY